MVGGGGVNCFFGVVVVEGRTVEGRLGDDTGVSGTRQRSNIMRVVHTRSIAGVTRFGIQYLCLDSSKIY